MKKYGVVLSVALVLSLLAGIALAKDANQPKQEPNKPAVSKTETIVGSVAVTKDKDGKITEVKLTSRRAGEYMVVLDAKGLELGGKLDGKRARVEGTVETKGTVKWLTVKQYSEVAPRPPA